MKRLIVCLLALAVLLPMAAEAELYPRFGNIVDIEYDTDFVTVDDGLGNLWDFYSAPIAMYYYYGDLLVLLMDDNNTPDWIYDDQVIDAYYCNEEDCAEIVKEWQDRHRENFFSKACGTIFIFLLTY
mgnify:CR=1 FL=1